MTTEYMPDARLQLHVFRLLAERLGLQVSEKRGRQVALTKRGDNNHDGLAFVFWATANLRPKFEKKSQRKLALYPNLTNKNLNGSSYRRSRGDANEDSFFDGKASGSENCLLTGDFDHLVEQVGVTVGRDKARPDALNLVWSGILSGQDRGLLRFHRYHFQRRVHRAQKLTQTKKDQPRHFNGQIQLLYICIKY